MWQFPRKVLTLCIFLISQDNRSWIATVTLFSCNNLFSVRTHFILSRVTWELEANPAGTEDQVQYIQLQDRNPLLQNGWIIFSFFSDIVTLKMFIISLFYYMVICEIFLLCAILAHYETQDPNKSKQLLMLIERGGIAAYFPSPSLPQWKLHLCISMHGWSAI